MDHLSDQDPRLSLSRCQKFFLAGFALGAAASIIGFGVLLAVLSFFP